MRRLFLLQGPPGCGKSTFIEQQGLSPWTVASDVIRLLFRGPEMNESGKLAISSSEDAAVWRTLQGMVKSRLRMGDLTIVDATHTRRREIEAYRELAAHYRYETYIVSWKDLGLEECRARNAQRLPLRQVPERVVDDMHARLGRWTPPDWTRVITPGELRDSLQDPLLDGSPYRRVQVFGCLQGSGAALTQALPAAPRDDELYIFAGNYVGAGRDNAALLTRLHELAKRPNVRLLEGERERHLRAWAQARPATSGEFDQTVRAQLEAGAVDRAAVADLVACLHDCLLLAWRGQRVLVSHGGLTAMPEPGRLLLLPAAQTIRGVGAADADIDARFTRAAPANAWQIHARPPRAGSSTDAVHNATATAARSLSVGGAVELGERLRVVDLADDGQLALR